MKLILFTVFLFSINTALASFSFPDSLYKKVPFSTQFSESGAIILNVNLKPVSALKKQIETKYGIKLKDRGEAHITLITPPEAQGWFTDKKGINYVYSVKEIIKKYQDKIQNFKFTVKCVGKQEENKSKKSVYYLVVESSDILKFREEIQRVYESRMKDRGLKTYFEAHKNYYPHITIGFIKGDVHGVDKGLSSCLD